MWSRQQKLGELTPSLVFNGIFRWHYFYVFSHILLHIVFKPCKSVWSLFFFSFICICNKLHSDTMRYCCFHVLLLYVFVFSSVLSNFNVCCVEHPSWAAVKTSFGWQTWMIKCQSPRVFLPRLVDVRCFGLFSCLSTVKRVHCSSSFLFVWTSKSFLLLTSVHLFLFWILLAVCCIEYSVDYMLWVSCKNIMMSTSGF